MASFCALLLCRKRLDVHSPNIQFENMSSNATRIHNFEMQPVYIYLLYYYPLANKGVQKLKTYIHSKISDHRMLPVLVNEILSSFTCCKSLLHTCIHLSIDKWQFEGPDVMQAEAHPKFGHCSKGGREFSPLSKSVDAGHIFFWQHRYSRRCVPKALYVYKLPKGSLKTVEVYIVSNFFSSGLIEILHMVIYWFCCRYCELHVHV